MNYYEYIDSNEWRKKAKAAKRRAGNRCQLCNSPNDLQAHHRTYERLGNELPGDITVLCRACHEKFHGVNQPKTARQFIAELKRIGFPMEFRVDITERKNISKPNVLGILREVLDFGGELVER